MLLENESGASEPPAPAMDGRPPRRARHERASPHRRRDHGLSLLLAFLLSTIPCRVGWIIFGPIGWRWS